ncbi:UNVERIFIED_CONTAM: Ubiquitin-conjugating enzyme E2 J1 [Siphonaria sp. JEL0065]|nr:Ubiquitin-conjugating enzyme E2 J1 [Siphonaria sp. JEL0065]
MSRSAAVKRLMKEYMDLEQDPSSDFVAYPISDENVFEWHFTLRGPDEGGFSGGKYHGRIVFPADYPFKPPDMYFLTPNGRFELNKKICLSITGFHAETWRPAWGIRSALTALISFFPTEGNGAIGALDYTHEERAIIAKKSQDWTCIGICARCEGVKMKDLLTDELLDKERTKVEGADEIRFSVKAASTESVASPSGAGGNAGEGDVGDAKSPTNSVPPTPNATPAVLNATSGSAASPSTPAIAAPDASNGLRQRNVPTAAAPTNIPAAAAAAPTAPATAAVHIDPAVEAYYKRRRQIDTAILCLSGLALYIVIRRLGLMFA